MQAKHWWILTAFVGALGVQLAGLEHGWHDAMTPTFIGGLLVQLATLLTGMFTERPNGNGAPAPMAKVGPVLVLAFAVGASSCAGGLRARHIATVSIVAAHSAVAAIDDTERSLVCGTPTAPSKCITEAKHRELSQRFVQAYDYDIKINRVVRAWPPGTPTPAEALRLLEQLRALISSILADLPSSPKVDQLLVSLGGTR